MKREPTLNDPRKFKAPYNPRERIGEEFECAPVAEDGVFTPWTECDN